MGYEVFAGNRNDVATLEEVVELMERKYGKPNRIWVVDRGIVSEDNLLDKNDWSLVREGLEVKLIDTPHGQERFVLCRSRDRALAGPQSGR